MPDHQNISLELVDSLLNLLDLGARVLLELNTIANETESGQILDLGGPRPADLLGLVDVNVDHDDIVALGLRKLDQVRLDLLAGTAPTGAELDHKLQLKNSQQGS